MSKPRSKLINYSVRNFRTVKGFTTEIHFGKQQKHFLGSASYISGRSIVTLGIEELQHAVERLAGSGTWVTENRELIQFGKQLGYWISGDGLNRVATQYGIIHYGKSGAHVVPARPRRSIM